MIQSIDQSENTVVDIEQVPVQPTMSVIHNWRPPCSCGVELREVFASESANMSENDIKTETEKEIVTK